MLKSSILSVLAATTLTVARAIESRDTSATADFDQFPCNTPNKFGFEVRQNVRTYKVFFGRMYLLQPGNDDGSVSAGILPGSGRNVAAYEQTTDPFIVPFITIPPGNTDVSSFDLASFKFGCVSGGDTAKGVSSCVIGVNGYRNSQKVASQSFNYIPGTVTKANMTEAQLNTSFKNLDRVEFATTYDPTVKQNGTTYIDNVKYTAHEGS